MAMAAAMTTATLTAETTTWYAYYGGDEGGLAELTVDDASGAMTTHRKIFHSPGNPRLEELARSEDGRWFALSNRMTEARSIFVLDASQDPPAARRVDLPQRADHLLFHDGLLLAVGHKGEVYLIDPEDPHHPRQTRNLDRAADLKAGALGKPVMTPDGQSVCVLVGENDDDNDANGGRVLILDWPTLELAHDIHLPAEQTDLHYPEGSNQRNPMPVDLVFCQETDTVAIALELYGAALLADADAFLDGNLTNTVLLPTSKDGSPGTGFPTSLFQIKANGRPLLVADNSGEDGGCALIDPATRERIAWLDTGPTSLGRLAMVNDSLAVASRAGLRSFRGQGETETSHSEQDELVLIDFQPPGEGSEPAVKRVPFDDFVYFATPVSPGDANHVLIAFFGKEDRQLDIATYHPATREIIERVPAMGVVRGFTRETGR